MPNFLSEQILADAESLRRMPERFLRMELARAAGISYKMAQARWPDADDISMEFAFNIVKAERSWESCQGCGVDVSTMYDERGKPLNSTPWKYELVGCRVCHQLNELNKSLDEDVRQSGTSWRMSPRGEGDPLIHR